MANIFSNLFNHIGNKIKKSVYIQANKSDSPDLDIHSTHSHNNEHNMYSSSTILGVAITRASELASGMVEILDNKKIYLNTTAYPPEKVFGYNSNYDGEELLLFSPENDDYKIISYSGFVSYSGEKINCIDTYAVNTYELNKYLDCKFKESAYADYQTIQLAVAFGNRDTFIRFGSKLFESIFICTSDTSRITKKLEHTDDVISKYNDRLCNLISLENCLSIMLPHAKEANADWEKKVDDIQDGIISSEMGDNE